jgi:LacI family transcriptional regulator
VETIRTRGLEGDDELIRICDGFSEPSGAKACTDLLDARPDVTSIMACNDLIALGC